MGILLLLRLAVDSLELFCSRLELLLSVALFDSLSATLDSKCVVRDISCDSRACRCVCALADSYRCNKVCVTADESIVLDNSSELLVAVVVYCYNATAEVYI